MGRRPVSSRKPSIDLGTPTKNNPLTGLLGAAYEEGDDDAATPRADAKVDNFLAEIDHIVGGKTDVNDETKPSAGPWQKVWDANHKAYYYWHSGTNEVTWTEPTDFGKKVAKDPVPVGGDSKEKRRKPSRFGQAPPEVTDLADVASDTKEKRNRSPSPAESDDSKPKSKAAKVNPVAKSEDSKGGKSERAHRVREIMIKLGMGNKETGTNGSNEKNDQSTCASKEQGSDAESTLDSKAKDKVEDVDEADEADEADEDDEADEADE
jgi:hypothetical protein